MKLNKFATALGLALGLGWAAAPASASYVHYSFEDDDIDFVLDANGNLVTSGPLQVGYTLASAFEIPVFKKNGQDAIPAGQELTGIAAVTIKQIVVSPAPGGVGTTYIFDAPTIALDTLPGYAGPTLGTGAAIAMFFNGTSGAGGDRDLDLNRASNPATNCTSLSDCVQQATLGTLYQVDGFLGDPDEFWTASQIVSAPGGGAVPIEQVLNTNNNLLIAAFNLGLSNLYQLGGPVHYINIATGLYCGNPGPIADGCVQLSGSGTLTGGQGLSNGAVAHSDFDAQKYVVPEPATLGLLGLGLLGLGLMRRRLG